MSSIGDTLAAIRNEHPVLCLRPDPNYMAACLEPLGHGGRCGWENDADKLRHALYQTVKDHAEDDAYPCEACKWTWDEWPALQPRDHAATPVAPSKHHGQEPSDD